MKDISDCEIVGDNKIKSFFYPILQKIDECVRLIQVLWRENHFYLVFDVGGTEKELIVMEDNKESGLGKAPKHKLSKNGITLMSNSKEIISKKTIQKSFDRTFIKNMKELIANSSYSRYKRQNQISRGANMDLVGGGLDMPIIPDFIFGVELFSAFCFPKYSISNHLGVYLTDPECSEMGVFFPPVQRISRFHSSKGIYHPLLRNKGRSETTIIIDYNEKDVLFGAYDRISPLICEYDKDKKIDNITLRCQCTPHLIGDDWASFTKSRAKKTSKAYNYSIMEKDFDDDIAIDTINKRIGNKNKKRKTNKHKKICIFGNSDIRSKEEIKSLLLSNKIELIHYFFPNLDGIESIVDADLCVFIENDMFKDAYNYLTSKYKLNTLILDPPYGIEGTQKFIKSICDKLNTRESQTYTGLLAKYKREIKHLRKKAKGIKTTLIINERNITGIYDPSKFYLCIPLLKSLLELGFDLELVLLTKKRFNDSCSSIRQSIGTKLFGRLSIIRCNSISKLDYILNKSNKRCLLSNLNLDLRASQSGNNQFSLHIIEQGFEGALRAAETIIRKSTSHFHDDFNRYNISEARPIEFKNEI